MSVTLKEAFPYTNERTGIFIDGSNLFASLQALNVTLDYKKLLELFREHCYVVRANYFTALFTDDDNIVKMRPLVDFLSYNGYNVITKAAKRFIKEDGTSKIKGNMDVEFCLDAVRAAEFVDHLVLFTGDGDFRYLVETLQHMGKRVTVISTIESQPAMCADELRKQADNYIDLKEIAHLFAK